MTNIEKMAWRIAVRIDYQPATFWGELSTDAQDEFKKQANQILVSVEHNILNGNWTTAIETVLKYSGLKMCMLELKCDDRITLADYVIEELREC